MRKKLLKIFGLVALFAVALTGCATVSNIQNDSDELIFNGGSVAKVGDYLYFANAYTPLSGATTDYAYAANAKLSYLNRANLKEGFNLPTEPPKKTEKVNSQVIGFESSYIFVLGDYVYFAAPNQHKTNTIEYAYNLLTLWRSRLNGDDMKELYTTDQYNSSTAKMRVLKGSDGAYYWLVYDGTDITSIKLGSTLGKKQVLAEDVTSVAMPNENDDYALQSVFYTKGSSGSVTAYYLNYVTGETDSVASNESDISFVDRIGDTVFYTSSGNTYAQTLTSTEGVLLTASEQYKFYDSTRIKELYVVDSGYIFTAGSEGQAKLLYKSNDNSGDPVELLAASDYSQIMHVQGDWIYYASGNDIKCVSVSGVNEAADVNPQIVVTMSSAITGKASSDGTYLYYYAGLEPINEDDDKTYEETSNNYLYRVRLGVEQNFQILSYFTRTEVKD